jgi:polyhydroxybutyrate depolymerase
VSMWSATKSRQTAWFASGLVATTLSIGGARRAMSQSRAEESPRDITLSQANAPLDQSIPKSISVGGVTRTYRLYVPRSFEAGHSALIVALHGRGAGGPGSAMEQFSQLDSKADQEGFAVAYLDGLVDATGTLNWNYYYDFFFTSGPDDIGFIRSVIDLLKQQLRPNPKRIYVTGTSAGGFMAQRVGVELSDRVAAIGVVEGGLYLLSPGSPPSIPNPIAPISVLFLKGDQDPNNQYCGAVFPSFNVTEASSDQDFDYWTGNSADRCEHISPAAPLCESVGVGDAQAHVTPGTPSALVAKNATGCRKGTEVKLYRLLGGADEWNQRPMNIPGAIPFNPDLDSATGTVTNDILWKFFREHPKADHQSDPE